MIREEDLAILLLPLPLTCIGLPQVTIIHEEDWERSAVSLLGTADSRLLTPSDYWRP